ncbi:MAG: FecR domain-containing protein [Pseudomonadota bacterium]
MTDTDNKSAPDPKGQADPVDDAAQDWFLLLSSPEATQEDRRRFDAWRASDRRHASAYEELTALWSDVEALKPVFASAVVHEGAPAPRRASPPVRPRLRSSLGRLRALAPPPAWAGLAAASLALVFFAGPNVAVSLQADYRTAAGEQVRAELPDGSIAWLNTDTAIDIRYDGQNRDVRLLRGEAQFDVVKNPARPFSVMAAGGRATALGTIYRVRLDDDRATVSVSEGRVAVRSPVSSPDETGFGGAELAAGEAVTFIKGAPPGAIEGAARSDTAWRRGFVAIDDMTLAEAFAEIDRYLPGKIVLLADVSGGERITARLAIDDLDQGLGALVEAQGLTLTRVSEFVTFVR